MGKTIGGGTLPPPRRFAYSWADEVEREEQEQRQQQQQQQCQRPPPRREERRERTKTDPFGAARPREVVLAEKGVDWRERDRELDAPHRSSSCRTRRAQVKRDARAAPAPAPPTPTTTPPRRRHAGSTPTAGHRKIDAPPVSCSGAWRGKRKCAGEVPMPARQVLTAAADQGRRVFGELNIGSGDNSSRRSSKKSCDSAGTGGTEARNVAGAGAGAGGENRGSSRAPAMSGMMKTDESEVGRKRVGKGRKRRKMGSKRTKKQQTLLL